MLPKVPSINLSSDCVCTDATTAGVGIAIGLAAIAAAVAGGVIASRKR